MTTTPFSEAVARLQEQGATVKVLRDDRGTQAHPDLPVERSYRNGRVELWAGTFKAAIARQDPTFVRISKHGRKKREAIRWVAFNDSPADGADPDQIELYITTTLIADLWYGGVPALAAQEIAWLRDHPNA